MSSKIMVSIADDHPLIIKGIRQIMDCCDDIQILASYTNGKELMEGLTSAVPDVLLLDLQMPESTGEEVAPLIVAQYPSVKIIALTNQDDTYYVKAMMRYGVSGYILKTGDADTIVDAIRRVHEGETFIEPQLKEKLVNETLRAKRGLAATPQLTRREKEVLQLIASNFNSQEIADQLYLSKRTIDNHRLSLLLKLDVKNAAALVKKAITLGLIK